MVSEHISERAVLEALIKLEKEGKIKKEISELTGGLIEVVNYTGSRDKAKYKCTVCGHEWETRSDHFKRQQYKCPNCKSGANL